MRLVALVTALLLAGCADMTAGQKKTAWIIGGIVAAGVVASDDGGSSAPAERECYIVVRGRDSNQVCN